MKKSLRRFLALTLVLAIGIVCVAALTACGGSEKYTYSEAKVESSMPEMNESMSTIIPQYNTLYKDSTMEVTDSKIVWTLKSGDKGEMSYTKEGDKLVLAGDYYDEIKEAFESLSVGMNVEVSIYGIKTTEGFELVISETISGVSTTAITADIRLLFVKA